MATQSAALFDVEILHTVRGDKKKQFDTSTEEGRQETAVFVNRMIKEGTAIFLETEKDTYRIKGYDPKEDRLIVAVHTEAGKTEDVPAKPGKRGRKTTAVPPRAGG